MQADEEDDEIAYIRGSFPDLNPSDYRIESKIDGHYNCIAWAARDDENWWQPSGFVGHYWPITPANAASAYGVQEHVRAFLSRGFELCDSGAVEPGYEKIAIYAHSTGLASHAARQLPDGLWTSKLGRGHDVVHQNVECLEGDFYGKVSVFMRRKPAGEESGGADSPVRNEENEGV